MKRKDLRSGLSLAMSTTILEICVREGITRAAMARRLGVSATALRSYEDGGGVSALKLLEYDEAFPDMFTGWLFMRIDRPIDDEHRGRLDLAMQQINDDAKKALKKERKKKGRKPCN